jgi:HTH-type transcriptional regulator/antitoxin HigA
MRPATKPAARLPSRYEDLAARMLPRAIMDEREHADAVEMIARLMDLARLSRGQEIYLETLVQLVEAYESAHARVTPARGIDALRALLDDHDLSASDLARILDLHPSMGSKVLRGERSLTLDHVRALAARFGVRPDTFIA